MQILIDCQVAEDAPQLGIPSHESMEQWARCALTHVNFDKDCELSVRFVSNDEIQSLNRTYRDKDKPTNILSFPFETPDCIPEEEDGTYLGDFVIAMDVVQQEAKEQHKSLTEHLAHLMVHGCLHLLGFDHIDQDEAEEMEGLEIEILDKLGYANPYEER